MLMHVFRQTTDFKSVISSLIHQSAGSKKNETLLLYVSVQLQTKAAPGTDKSTLVLIFSFWNKVLR